MLNYFVQAEAALARHREMVAEARRLGYTVTEHSETDATVEGEPSTP